MGDKEKLLDFCKNNKKLFEIYNELIPKILQEFSSYFVKV